MPPDSISTREQKQSASSRQRLKQLDLRVGQLHEHHRYAVLRARSSVPLKSKQKEHGLPGCRLPESPARFKRPIIDFPHTTQEFPRPKYHRADPGSQNTLKCATGPHRLHAQSVSCPMAVRRRPHRLMNELLEQTSSLLLWPAAILRTRHRHIDHDIVDGVLALNGPAQPYDHPRQPRQSDRHPRRSHERHLFDKLKLSLRRSRADPSTEGTIMAVDMGSAAPRCLVDDRRWRGASAIMSAIGASTTSMTRPFDSRNVHAPVTDGRFAVLQTPPHRVSASRTSAAVHRAADGPTHAPARRVGDDLDAVRGDRVH